MLRYHKTANHRSGRVKLGRSATEVSGTPFQFIYFAVVVQFHSVIVNQLTVDVSKTISSPNLRLGVGSGCDYNLFGPRIIILYKSRFRSVVDKE